MLAAAWAQRFGPTCAVLVGDPGREYKGETAPTVMDMGESGRMCPVSLVME